MAYDPTSLPPSDGTPEPELGPELLVLHHALADAMRPPRLPAAEAEALALDIMARATRHPEHDLPRRGRFTSARTWGSMSALGVVVSLVFVIGVLFFGRSHGSGVSVVRRRYETQLRQCARITLPDGSHVMLAPRTTLVLESGFGRTTRTVSLTGEAFFDVHDHRDAPFVVRAGDVVTRVLGTSFAVRSYPTDSRVRVAVNTGKVTVGALVKNRPTLTLTAGAVGDVSDSSAMVISVDSAERYTAWTSGELVFHEASTKEVLAALTRWYGYQFALGDSSLAGQHLTMVLDATSMANALETLKSLLDVDITFRGNLATLHPRAHHRLPAKGRRGAREPLTIPPTEVGR